MAALWLRIGWAGGLDVLRVGFRAVSAGYNNHNCMMTAAATAAATAPAARVVMEHARPMLADVGGLDQAWRVKQSSVPTMRLLSSRPFSHTAGVALSQISLRFSLSSASLSPSSLAVFPSKCN